MVLWPLRGWRHATRRGVNRSLTVLLLLLQLLLHLDLPLLHFLQHLLRSLHARLVRSGWRALVCVSRRLIRNRILGGFIRWRIRIGRIARGYCGLSRILCGLSGSGIWIVRTSLGHEDDAHQFVGVFW